MLHIYVQLVFDYVDMSMEGVRLSVPNRKVWIPRKTNLLLTFSYITEPTSGSPYQFAKRIQSNASFGGYTRQRNGKSTPKLIRRRRLED